MHEFMHIRSFSEVTIINIISLNQLWRCLFTYNHPKIKLCVLKIGLLLLNIHIDASMAIETDHITVLCLSCRM